MALNEDWKPEIEHIKGSDLLKKKKKKVDLPPHLRLSAMKKAFAHTNEACWKGYKAYGMKKKGGKMVPNCKPVGSVKEENALEKRAKENEKARKWLKKDAKKSGYTDIALRASMSKGAGVSEAASYKEFMKDKKQAKARLDKKISDRKEKDKLFVDIKKKGIKFYDKTGSGRIQGGRKVYD